MVEKDRQRVPKPVTSNPAQALGQAPRPPQAAPKWQTRLEDRFARGPPRGIGFMNEDEKESVELGKI